ncbi:hypothetical protein Tco_0989889 [Tanacetum coccineum]|uniref:Uncharacterized protein n=1 Tax=Tanacetum coccineum TaxID=301880 RepID=A0ABQ5EV35_9ASTR
MEVYSEDTRRYWRIIRVGNHTEAYQIFADMLKKFDRDDLVKLWDLVKKRFSTTEPTDDKEKELWVELKRLFEPDNDDILWKLQRYMHDPLVWRLYDTCGVHHVSSVRGHDIFMLVEKEYPLTRGTLGLMMVARLLVEADSEMSRELLRKIFYQANRPRQGGLLGIKASQVSTAEWPTGSWREDGYCNGGNLPGAYIVGNMLRYQDLEWYDALKDSELKEEALRNKAIMEGLINEDVESNNEGWKRWNDFEITNDDRNEWEYENEHEDDERYELCGNETHEFLVCTIRRFEMIKYSFGQDEEYVAVKEDEYADLTNTSEDACLRKKYRLNLKNDMPPRDKIDGPNITIEEYIRLEEEKAQKHGKVFNWETAKYGKIWYDEDVHDLRSIETEFPAIVFNDNFKSNETLFCEPTVSSLNNNKIDFRISFDKSDDEDYMVIFDKNSFSYKIISTNDLKTDSENDNEKVNMPLFPSPEPLVSCIDDLDFFKDFENKFPAIVYNDALTSKSDFSTEPTLCPQYINEFYLKYETSLSEYDEVKQNVLYFNDLFPFNIIYLDDLKSDKDDDDNEINMIQSSGGRIGLQERIRHIRLTPIGQTLWLRYQVEGYTEEIVHDFEQRLKTIFGRQVNQVYTLDFEGLTLDIRQDLAERLRMVYIGDDGLHIVEEMAEDEFGPYWLGSERVIPDKGDLSDYWVEISSGRDFLRGPKRQQVAAAGALEAAEDALAVDEGAQADLAPRASTLTATTTSSCGSLCGLVERSMTDRGRFSTWMISCMTQLMDASGQTYQAFDGAIRGSSPAVFEKHTRKRTKHASTSSAPTKTCSEFSTTICEYVTEPSTLSKSRAELRKESVYKSVEAEEKSNLKTSL